MFKDANRSVKPLSPKEAKLKAADYCAYQERSQQEVRDRLYNYGLHRGDVEEILSTLIVEGFINEERFARSYIRGKFRIKKWGRNKILQGLKRHKISAYCIKKGWEEISEAEYTTVLNELLKKKTESLKEKNAYVRQQKIASFLTQRGFEPNLIWEALRNQDKSKFVN